jgi:hypothetical protein
LDTRNTPPAPSKSYYYRRGEIHGVARFNSHGKGLEIPSPLIRTRARRSKRATTDTERNGSGGGRRAEVTEEVEQVAAVGVASGWAAEEGLSVGEVPRGVREVLRHGEQEVAGVRERVPEAEHPAEAHAPSPFRRSRRRQHHHHPRDEQSHPRRKCHGESGGPRRSGAEGGS